MTTLEEIRATVQARYGATAQRVLEGATTRSSCCGSTEGSSGCCGAASERWDPITADLYDAGETAGIPAEALLASLGCGNPTALADLREGEVVLDLGSGGGIDVLLSARRVGPTRLAESSTSMPPPDPRSSTVSPSRRSASAVGLPQPSDASIASCGISDAWRAS